MITLGRARHIAEEALEAFGAKYGVEVAIDESGPGAGGIQDYGDAWVVHWNSVEYLRSRDFTKQLLIGPIAVPKIEAATFVVLGTAGTVDEELDAWRRRDWGTPAPTFRYYRSYAIRPDGTTADRALFRRELREDPRDTSGDAVFEADGRWHLTRDLRMIQVGLGRHQIREITEHEASAVVTDGFGSPATALHAAATAT